MILWSQQIKEINDAFLTFQTGEKVNIRLSKEFQEKNKIFLNPSKFESMTLSNFRVMVLYQLFKKAPPSLIKFLTILNSLNKQDINESNKFKSELLSYNFIVKRDFETLKSLTLTPYEAYQEKKIHMFTMQKYYSTHPELIKGRIMKLEVKRLNSLMSYFKIKEINE